MRAMKYEQIAAKMKARNLEVTDDLLDAFIQFAGNHQEGAGDATPESRAPSASPAAAPAEESPEEESNLSPHVPPGKPVGCVPWTST